MFHCGRAEVFKNNSLIIVHKAIVEYFMNSVPVEDTINKAENIFDFQMICKTGGTFQNNSLGGW